MSVPKPLQFDWWVASRTLAGETVCGDAALVKPFSDGVLLAAIDGVGHGGEASSAANVALGILNAHAEEPVVELIQRCHAALAQTRGVVMTLASVRGSDESLTWLGVGNVEGRLLRADGRNNHSPQTVLLRGGLVGYQLPSLAASVVPLSRGDVLILATDGIDPGFAEGLHASGAPRVLAEWMLTNYFKGKDDALVLVARYLGRADG